MRTSHRTIRKMILDRMSKISDDAFFTSKAYRAYLTDLVEAATRRYKRPFQVCVIADHDEPTIAFTDFQGVYINTANRITSSFPSRTLRSLSIVGLLSHETGHILFTDNRVWDSCFRRLGGGTFYPKLPDGLTQTQKLYADEICEALQNDDDPVPQRVILRTYHDLSNILEDGYVDARYSYEFPGVPAQGIALNNRRYAETMPDLTEMINKKYYDHNIVSNLLIQYARAGEVNNLSGYSGELLDKVNDCIPLIDAAIYDDDARSRCEAANMILINLWPLMQRCFDALRQQQKDAEEDAKQQAQQSGSESQDGNTGDSEQSGEEAEQSAGIQAVDESLNGQIPAVAPNFTLKTSAVPSGDSFIPNQEQMDALRTRISKVLAEETARIAEHETDSVSDGVGGGVSNNTDYDGSGYETAAEDIERVLENVAESEVQTQLEEEHARELQLEAQSISYGNAHANISITVNRMSQVDQSLIDSYHAVAPQLLQLSKRLQKGVSTVLKEKRQGGKLTGLVAGKRLNQHALYRTDGRVFCNARLPSEPIRMSVALLVDESGSMCGNDRITRARATAIVIQDFCEKLEIPTLIMGHTAWNRHVELFSYSDFDSVDKLDRYRLMDMSARDCNRDGAALRYCAEKLSRQQAEVKLLIIICDGQPNDDGYSGSAAEADLRGIKQEYSRKGIQFFAAAIGEDREKIERIYGDGYLDITDLNQLPILLTTLISRKIK
jgi:hypothetical protein